MEKETNKSKLKDDQYFANLEQKMMQHANENEHRQSVFPLYAKWISVAAILVLGILTFSYLSQENNIEPIALKHQDTQKQIAITEIDTVPEVIDEEVFTPEFKIAQAEEAIIQQVDFSEIEEVIPTESSETEEDLLDMITEEELDELLAEYT